MTHERAGSGGRAHHPQARVPRSAAVYRRRRIVVGVLALLVLVSLLAFSGLVWPGFLHAEEPDPVPTVTVTASPPTPTIKPMQRPGGETAFQEALPSSVLQFALTDMAETDAADESDATEGWKATYTDGGDLRVVVTATQWPNADGATTSADALTEAAGKAKESGDVKVGDDVVGRYALTPADGGQRTMTWRNGTAVLQATGPADVIKEFYRAFPL
ncbi:hypothetical protein [Myceligenerans pegani]|uniref:Uncharacterized protein n=1 Tax=Myceligenerans pegani TaxID=2776917 RepID=A0ABR9N4S9_9MICO|nr:hypothetical protein [Myceligenerans sp. TRM 65318]MBE1878669.1 hypothetical protein [Myceligenerans sp. TRM 65318]MBE3020940.1 hypothetical protein [Myceligenerans sp. TRM 65318]